MILLDNGDIESKSSSDEEMSPLEDCSDVDVSEPVNIESVSWEKNNWAFKKKREKKRTMGGWHKIRSCLSWQAFCGDICDCLDHWWKKKNQNKKKERSPLGNSQHGM